MPNGIDDCREKLNGEFNAFWKEIKESALLIDPKLLPASLAVRLVIQELAAIGTLPEQEIQIGRLTNLASYLPAIELDRLAREFNKIFKISRTTFCQSAKQIRSQRREQEIEQAQARAPEPDPAILERRSPSQARTAWLPRTVSQRICQRTRANPGQKQFFRQRQNCRSS